LGAQGGSRFDVANDGGKDFVSFRQGCMKRDEVSW
jgi:hypothetical protein